MQGGDKFRTRAIAFRRLLSVANIIAHYGNGGYSTSARLHPLRHLDLDSSDYLVDYITSHNGLDIAGKYNDEIIAPADGTVTEVTKERFLGKVLRLDHGHGVETVFGHLNRFAAKKGQKVKRGQVIAYMGNTGRSTGTHLHYSVLKEERYIDPRQFIWDYDFENDSFTPYASMSEH